MNSRVWIAGSLGLILAAYSWMGIAFQATAFAQESGGVREDACPGCKRGVRSHMRYCPNCGTALPSGAKSVPKAATAQEMEPYESADGTLFVYKPRGWKVEEKPVDSSGEYSVRILHPSGDGRLDFVHRTSEEETLTLAKRMLADSMRKNTGFAVEKLRSTRDRNRVRALVRFTEDGRAIRSHWYFTRSERGMSCYVLAAREDGWEKIHPLLARTVANLTYSPKGVRTLIRKANLRPENRSFTPSDMLRAASVREGKRLPMKRVEATDTSFSVEIPKGWSFEGQFLGGKIFSNPRTRQHGFVAMGYEVLYPGAMVPSGGLVSPYLSPSQTLGWVLEQEGMGQSVKVVSDGDLQKIDPDALKLIQFLLVQGFTIEHRVFFARFTNPNTRQASCGIFYVMCGTYPNSYGWSCNVQGFWAPVEEFEDYLPLFYRMSESSQINRAWVQATMDAQMASAILSVKRMIRSISELSRAYDSYNRGWWQNQRRYDYIYWRWSQATLEQGTWVSTLEGGRMVDTDPWGMEHQHHGRLDGPPYTTTEFTGRDPWTGEHLEEVDTFEEWKKYVDR